MAIHIRRREFISTLCGVAVVWPLAVRAQQGERMRRVGVLMSLAEDNPQTRLWIETFVQRLRQLGWIEGQNLILDVRTAEGDFSRLPGVAAELVALRPDAILVGATPA